MNKRRYYGNGLKRNSSGVSEIIGDILLVSIAVVMVGALAYQLGTVQQPVSIPMASLTASYDGVNVTVMHNGGDPLMNHSTRFYLLDNETFVESLSVADGRSGADRLSIGQNWTVSFPSNATDSVRLQVIDTGSMNIIFDKMLQHGPETAALPDLGLTPSDIMLIRNNTAINTTGNAPMTNETILVNCTIHNFGGSGVPSVQVRITDYAQIDHRTYNVANFTLAWLGPLSSANISASYLIQNGSWGVHTMNVKVIPVYNESRFANNYASKDYYVGYPILLSHPSSPYLRIRVIDFSDDHPVHGSTILINSRIINQGGVPANATVTYYDNNKMNLIGVDSGLGVPVGGESASSIFWKTAAGGLHTIIVNVTDPNGTGDEKTAQVEVLPTILLVDDDRVTSGVRDVITPMEAALDSSGATYTVHTVGGGDGPAYDSGDHPMQDYDLVIWMTGYESSNTLTANDQASLYRYLYESHGKLWLIGQDIVSDLRYNNPFLDNALQLDPTTPWAYNLGTPNPIVGKAVLNNTTFPVTTPFPAGVTNTGDFVRNTTKAAVGFCETTGAKRPVALLFNATTNGSADTYMAALFSFELTEVQNPNNVSVITYAMLDWFNCSAMYGRDLAISDQEFNISTPSYMNKVNITVWVRNNGMNDEPPDFTSPILQIGFYVDGRPFSPANVTVVYGNTSRTFGAPTSEIWIPQSTPVPGLVIPRHGGFIKVSMVWIANSVGDHTVTVKVDPYNYIDENNEFNNQVPSSITDGSIFVRYGILLIDDDQSANNGGTGYNSTANISRALDDLGYGYDIYIINGSATDGPTLGIMKQYNAIIWCSGQSANSTTATDQSNLETFLLGSDQRYLWLIGQDAVAPGDYSNGTNTFVRDFLRVAQSVDPASPKTPSNIEGANQDPVAHGINYPAVPTFNDSGGLIVPYIDGNGMTYQSPMPDTSHPNEVVECNAEDGTTSGWYVRQHVVGTTDGFGNVFDPMRDSKVISLTRSGVNAQDTVFIIGDFSPTNDQNPNDLPWVEKDHLTATWSFSYPIDYDFGWHVTDNLMVHHTLFYSSADVDTSGVNPEFGLGGATTDGEWHTVTRDLLSDLRAGTGNGALTISSVDGFEVWMNEGTGKVDDISLVRPFNSVRYENDTLNFKTVFTAWDPSFISYTGNDNYTSELTYMVMRWFDLYDARFELRVTNLDLYYGNMLPLREMKPVIGESYVLKAMVWNPGGSRGDVVVRFMDGTTVIDSVTISVGASSKALAEIVWTPLFAGSRTIGAVIDPDNMVTEIFKFNDYAGIKVQCYFFYDDMENGTTNWNHDSTLLRINGESSLEYMDPGTVNSNIKMDWDTLNGISKTPYDYHSYPYSYRLIAPAIQDFTYTFYLTYDPWANSFGQGFYVVAIQKDAYYVVQRYNTATKNYDDLYTNTLTKGNIAVYTSQQDGCLYKIHSFGPLLVVITSSEGSNVNVANYDDGLARGYNFTVMGDMANKLGADTHVAVVALENNAHVTVKWYDFTPPSTVGLLLRTDTSGVLNYGDRYHDYAPGHNYVMARISSDKAVLAYRLSNDNDELDTAMSVDGYTYGKEFYFCAYRSNNAWPWRFDISNIEASVASNVNIYESTATTGWAGWSLTGQSIGAHTSTVFSRAGPPNDGNLHYFKVTSDRNVTVVFGQEESSPGDFANNCQMIGPNFFVDAVWDYREVTDQPGNFVIKTPQLYASNSNQGANLLENEYQDFSFGTATTWSVNPGLPVLGTGAGNPSSQGGIRYVSTVPIYIQVQAAGTLNNNQTLLDATSWVGYNLDVNGFANFTLPAGAHTFQWKTNFVTAGSLKIVQFWTDSGGEIVWQLWPTIGDDPSTVWNEATSDIGDGHWWTFTATHRFLYLVGGAGNCWIHTILPFEGAVETPGIMRSADDGADRTGQGAGTDGDAAAATSREAGAEGAGSGRGTSDDFNATTQPFSLVGYSSAQLSYYQKYALQVGANGVVILVGNDTAGDGNYKFQYVKPKRPYTGNIRFDIPSSRISDDFGHEMRWCFNGISTNGLGQWDYITVDLTPFIGQVHVKVRFLYINATMTNVGYWYVDDVVVKAGRGDASPSTNAVDDQWELVTKGASLSGGDTADALSGLHAWLCHDPSFGVDYLKGGIDDSLTTVPIDLTNALDAALDVRFKFNINSTEGRPPDGFRVEVSSDNGETWQAINHGVRSSSQVSGTVGAGPDGKSVTGVNLGNNWVASATMSRLDCDLSGWAGHVILVRFRVVTRTDIATHYESNVAGFGGVYIDDVKVTGNTTTGSGRSIGEGSMEQGAGGTEQGTGSDGQAGASQASGATQTSGIDKDGVDPTVYNCHHGGNGKEDIASGVWTGPSAQVRTESATVTGTVRFGTTGGGKR